MNADQLSLARTICVKELEFAKTEDTESGHLKADRAIVDFLRAIGHDDIADLYDEIRDELRFWYA